MISRSTILIIGALVLAACAEGPRDIAFGVEECAHCRMLVSEEAFAAQLRSDLGRSYVFDAIECLAEFVQGAEADDVGVGAMWVTDFSEPGTWVAADAAYYLQSPDIRSPMGMNLSAFADRETAEEYRATHGGEIFNWRGVKDLVSERRVASGGRHVH